MRYGNLSYRIAHVCPVSPALTGNGLAMRVGVFTEAAASLGKCLVVALDSRQTSMQQRKFFDANVLVMDCNNRLDTRLRLIRQVTDVELRINMFKEYGRPVDAMSLSDPVIKDVQVQLSAFAPDLIIVSRAYLIPVIWALPDQLKATPVLLDLDDDDASLKRRFSLHERALGRIDNARWFEAEAQIYDTLIEMARPRVRMFTCASNAVRNGLSCRLVTEQTKSISNVAPDVRAKGRSSRSGSNLLFVGTLDYLPNRDGVEWLVREIWPRLQKLCPEAKITIAGSEPPADIRSICREAGFELVADPPELRRLYTQASAAIVPLRLGSGSRIKILEAGAFGVPVISTHAGADGLELDPDTHAYLCDSTADGFAQACAQCLGNENQRTSRAEALQLFVQTKHNRTRIVGELGRIIKEVANRHVARTRS